MAEAELTGRLLDLEYAITVDDDELAAYLTLVLMDSLDEVSRPVSIEIRSTSTDSYSMRMFGELLVPSAGALRIVSHLLWQLNRRSSSTDRLDRLYLHAGGVARDGRAALIVGSSGAGKTTSTIHLARSGFLCLSDDVIELTAGGLVRGSRKPIGLRSGTTALLGLGAEVSESLPLGLSSAGSRPIAISALGVDFADTARVGAVVFPVLDGRPGSTRAVSRAVAAQRLVQNSFDRKVYTGGGLGLLAEMLGDSRAVEWTRGPLDSLESAIAGLLHDGDFEHR